MKVASTGDTLVAQMVVKWVGMRENLTAEKWVDWMVELLESLRVASWAALLVFH